MPGTSPVEPNIAIPPGEHLEEELTIRELTVHTLAELMGVGPETIGEVVCGARPVTTEFAQDLERVLGIPSEIWLNLEANYRAALRRLGRESPDD